MSKSSKPAKPIDQTSKEVREYLVEKIKFYVSQIGDESNLLPVIDLARFADALSNLDLKRYDEVIFFLRDQDRSISAMITDARTLAAIHKTAELKSDIRKYQREQKLLNNWVSKLLIYIIPVPPRKF